MDIDVIDVPFDGYGRRGNQASAAGALHRAGLDTALAHHDLTSADPIQLPPPSTERGRDTSLVNETALLVMLDQVEQRVANALRAGRFPLLVGGDCTTLLATVPALRAGAGAGGLVFVDGHEDTMPLDVSEDGEAANAEIGLLLGITGRLLTGPLRRRTAALPPAALAVLGPRDRDWRRRFNVGSLREYGVWFRDATEVAADPAVAAREAVHHVRRTAERWWLHVDLDVLDPREFSAQGLPGVPDEPGGLTADQLHSLLDTASRTGGCAGLSLAIYDPDQDPDRADARTVVDLAAIVAGGAGS